tara:strand:- start:447 stop:1196 length:750 start_codon:yes stop_codon:yes gene_type:complete
MDDNFNSLLKQIESNKINVLAYSPTQQTDIELKSLTVDQQSVILDTISDITILQSNPIYLIIKFNTGFNNIIKQNINNEIFEKMTSVDRANIIISFRKEISNEVEQDGEIIDLSKILERNKTIKVIDFNETIVKDNFTFKVSVPTLAVDTIVNKILSKKLKDNPSSSNLISDIYLYEILKFVDSIQFEDGEEVTIKKDFKNLQLIKKINLSTLSPVIKFIEKVRDYEEEFITVPSSQEKLLLTPDLFVI